MKFRLLIRFILITAAVLILSGWGYNGHKIINNRTVFSFPAEMSQFQVWQNLLEQHASDADERKSIDPNEAPKHYIDIDNYPGFLSTGYITQNFDSAVNLYGYNFVLDQGILPWAIIAAYDSLTQSFSRRDWNKAILFAADLGHYVGDAHMPLHITRNYNGQYTGQTGIHSRYESSMINRYYNQISYDYDTVSLVTDIPGFVFSFIYSNYSYNDSLLAADLAAKAIAGNTTSDLYYQKLWEYTNRFTNELFRNSSYFLAALIYSSWTNADKPLLITGTQEEENKPIAFSLFQNYPNPFNPTTTISYSLASAGEVSIIIYSLNGEVADELINKYQSAGVHNISFNGAHLPSGIYFYTLKSGESKASGKMLLLK